MSESKYRNTSNTRQSSQTSLTESIVKHKWNITTILPQRDLFRLTLMHGESTM